MATKNSIYKSEFGRKQIQYYYTELLKDWPEPSYQHWIQTNYGETFVIESGSKSAPAVVLWHGAGSNAAMWAADAQKLSRKYRVFAIDIVGECGRSSENRPKFENAHYAHWLREILELLSIPKVFIVGNSLGGWIALDFAIQYPQKVDKLILIATAGVTPVKPSALFLLLLTAFTGNWGFKKLNQFVYRNLKLDNAALEFIRLIKDNYIPRTDAPPIFSDRQLDGITAPTFFIGGSKDCFYNTYKTARRLHATLQFSDSKVLENVGHVITGQTDAFIEFLGWGKNTRSYAQPLQSLIDRTVRGTRGDIDEVMARLTQDATLAETRNIDFALSFVVKPEGLERLKHYLFNGTQIQRNYATLYFNRRGDWKYVKQAYEQGLIDEVQAFAR